MLQPGQPGAAGWVLLLAQLPASPSSPRVMLWRRARAAGAAGLVNGAWVLPRTAAHEELFAQLAGTVREQGGSGFVLRVATPAGAVNAEIMARFGADRAREHDEFAERCTGLLAEIGKETRLAKFTFAELEEIEQDLDKLAGWLGKITARDFFPGDRAAAAAGTLQRCRWRWRGSPALSTTPRGCPHPPARPPPARRLRQKQTGRRAHDRAPPGPGSGRSPARPR